LIPKPDLSVPMGSTPGMREAKHYRLATKQKAALGGGNGDSQNELDPWIPLMIPLIIPLIMLRWLSTVVAHEWPRQARTLNRAKGRSRRLDSLQADTHCP
jgi:hypothetical protein